MTALLSAVEQRALLRVEIMQLERLVWTLTCQTRNARAEIDRLTEEIEDARLS